MSLIKYLIYNLNTEIIHIENNHYINNKIYYRKNNIQYFQQCSKIIITITPLKYNLISIIKIKSKRDII